jgi:hypothetical protein
MGPDGRHGDVEDHAATGMIGSLHCQIEQIPDDQRLGFTALEAPGVDDTADHDLDGVDAVDPGHRDEDAVPGKQLDDESFYPGRVAARPSLDDDVAHLSNLVASAVEHRQTPDPGNEDRRRSGRCHELSIPASARLV